MLRREFLKWLARITGGYVAVNLVPPLTKINTTVFSEARAQEACGQNICTTRDVGHTCQVRDVCDIDESGDCKNDECTIDQSGACENDKCRIDKSGSCKSDTCDEDSSNTCQSDTCLSDKSGSCVGDQCISDESGNCISDRCGSDKSGACISDECVIDKSGACKNDLCRQDSSGSCENDKCAMDISGLCKNDQCVLDKSGACQNDRCSTDKSNACVSDSCQTDESGQCKSDQCMVDRSGCSPDTCVLDGACFFEGSFLEDLEATTGNKIKTNVFNQALKWLYRLSSIILFTSALIVPQMVKAATFAIPPGDVGALIAAIETANGNGQDDTINLGAGTYTLTEVNANSYGAGLPSITSTITINGANPGTTTIQRNASAPAFRILHVAAGGNLTLNRLTIKGGSGETMGGGILNEEGTLTINNSTISGNSAVIDEDSNGVGGGGIGNFLGTVTIINSSIFNNSTQTDGASAGSGVENIGGTVTITNTTIYGNSAHAGELAAGGGISSVGGTMTATNATISGNSALTQGGDENSVAWGGGLFAVDETELRNSIIALNTATNAPDIFSSLVSNGHNLFGDLAGSFVTLSTGDLTGAAGLGSFTDNGTPGYGHLPLVAGSRAIDAADVAECSTNPLLVTDQLGQLRSPPCDIGAVEFQAAVSRPNFTPYQPGGWSDKIVVSNVTGTQTDSSPLYDTDTLYLDLAWINNGSAPITTTLYYDLYVDDNKTRFSMSSSFNAGQWNSQIDHPMGPLSPGSHTIRIVFDPDNNINETNEGDNEYTKTITVISRFTLTVSKAGSGSGTLTSSPGGIDCGSDCSETYNEGTNVTLTASPDAASVFAGWSGDPDCSDGSVTMTENRSCTATFNLQHPEYRLTVVKAGTGDGTVTSTGINCGLDCSEAYKKVQKVKITAKANKDSTFTGWSGGGCSGTAPCQVTVDSTITITASFALKIPQISTDQTQLAFGDVKVKKSMKKTLKITNNGTGDLIVTLSGLAGTEFITGGKSSITVKPKKSYNLNIMFKPTSIGEKVATLTLTSNDPDTATINISLSGTGI